MRIAATVLPVCVVLLGGASAPADRITPERAAAIDRIFEEQVEPGSPGCIVGLIRGSAVFHWRGYGRADVEAAEPFAPDTVLGTGSIYKPFIAAGVLLLAQEGRLALSDSVRRYLPELPEYAARITVRQLLDHTHGLREYPDLIVFAPGAREGDGAAIVRLLARQREPAAAPGERVRYGSTGPVLAGQILERISGEPVARLIARRVFDPIGMRSTALGEDGRRVPPRIAVYPRQPDGAFGRREPSFGYRTTISDLARWNGHFESSDSRWQQVLRQMSTPLPLANGTLSDFGLGLRVSPYRGLRRIWHPGAGTGYRTIFMRFPDQRFAIALGCNQEINPITAAEAIADVVLAAAIAGRGSTGGAAASDRRLPASQPRMLTGTYVSDTGRVVRIAARGDGFLLVFDGREYDLTSSGPLRFVIAGQPAIPRDPVRELLFRPSRRGETTLEIKTNWYPVTFRKVQPVDGASIDRSAYVGNYHSDEVGSSLRVFTRDDALIVATAQGEHRLDPVSRDLFSAGPQTIRFARRGGMVAVAIISRGATPRLAFEKAQ